MQIEKSNLKEIIFNNPKEHDKGKYKNVMLINNSNLICIFEKTEIRIYSYKIQNSECIFEIYQNLKYSSNLDNIKNYIQEEVGSKFYLLYGNAFVTVSKVSNYFQIENIITAKEGKFISFDKFDNKIYILKEDNQIIEINPINFNTPFLYHTTNIDIHTRPIMEGIFRRIEDFYIINNNYSIFSMILLHNQYGLTKYVFIFNIEKKSYIEFENYFISLIKIEKYKDQFIFIQNLKKEII